MNCVCAVGQDPHLVVVISIIESVVVRDLTILTRKMDNRQGSVAGRGLMGDSASCVLAGKFAGRVSVPCSCHSRMYRRYFASRFQLVSVPEFRFQQMV